MRTAATCRSRAAITIVMVGAALMPFCTPAARGQTVYYDVWRSTSDNPAAASQVVRWVDQTEWTDPDVIEGQAYNYWVRATQIQANDSAAVGFAACPPVCGSARVRLFCPTAAERGDPNPVPRPIFRLELRIFSSNFFSLDNSCTIRLYKGNPLSHDLLATWEPTIHSSGAGVWHTIDALDLMIDVWANESQNSDSVSVYAEIERGGSTGLSQPLIITLLDPVPPGPSFDSITPQNDAIHLNWSTAAYNTGFGPMGTGAWFLDCNGNTIDDACDISCDAPGCVSPCGLSNDCDEDWVPDECEVDSDNDDVIDDCDDCPDTIPGASVDEFGCPPGQTAGSIVAWGSNGVDVPSPNTNFVAVAAGWSHSMGLKADGSVVAWGNNYYGQCDVPPPNADFVAVAGGLQYSLGLKADGSIAAWGYNGHGQCDVPASNTDFVAVAAGGGHSLGLKADGSIVGWGANWGGQLDIPAPNTGFVAISASDCHSLGLKADGSVVAWWSNYYGECDVPAPNSGFVAITTGGLCGRSLGLKDDGSIVEWGTPQFNVPAPNTGFVAIAAGDLHSLGLKMEGATPRISSACCVADGTCVMLSELECNQYPEGVFEGPGVTCDPNPCALCGNGIVDTGEECDDANTDNNDACLSTCVAATCGDGFVQTGAEECDDGNTAFGDGCSDQCEHEGTCCGVGGTCTVTTEELCDALLPPGGYHGNGEICTGPTSCCLPDGSCADLDPLCCGDLGGLSSPYDAPICLGDSNGSGVDDACEAPPGTDLDLEIDHIELSQAIQRPPGQEQFPLVAGRPTLARVFIKWEGSLPAVVSVDGRIRIYVDGAAPMELASEGPIFNPPQSPNPNPINESDSLNFTFVAPAGGSIDLIAEINPDGVGRVPEIDYTNNTVGITADSVCRQGLRLGYVPIDYRPTAPGAGPNLPDLDRIRGGSGELYVLAVYPTPWVHYYMPTAEALVWEEDIDAPGADGRLANKLRRMRWFMWPNAPDFLYGWLPGDPYSGHGAAPLWGHVGFGHSENSWHQVTLAHELGHGFGLCHPSDTDPNCGQHGTTLLGAHGVDVENLLNLPSGRIKPDNFVGFMEPGFGTDQTWIDLTSYQWLVNSERFSCDRRRASTRLADSGVLAITGLFDSTAPTAEIDHVYELSSRPSTPHNPVGNLLLRAYAHTTEPTLLYELRFAAGALDCAMPQECLVPFAALVPTVGGDPVSDVDRIEIALAETGQVLAELVRSDTAPNITIISPTVGQVLTDGMQIAWTGSDDDGDTLHCALSYSWDSGLSFVPLAVDTTETTFTLNVERIPGSNAGQAILKLSATDGMNTVSVEVDGLTLDAKKAPEVHVTSPANEATALDGAPVLLSASAYDPEDGQLPADSIDWFSDLDGWLGSGSSLHVDTLSLGTHEVSVAAVDSDAMSATAWVTINVVERPSGTILGDFNFDGLVNLADFVNFGRCLAGPGNAPALDCPPNMNPDLDGEGDVDLRDFAYFQRALTALP